MNPDWYVDPLGRYEGRYWDGEQWTERVKESGKLVVDPDWPPASVDVATDTHEVTRITTASGVIISVDDDGARDFGTESPVRQVAVLGSEAGPARSNPDGLGSAVAGNNGGPSRGWWYLIGGVVLAAGLLVALLPRLTDDDAPGDDVNGAAAGEPSGAELPDTRIDDDENTDDATTQTQSGDDASQESTPDDGVAEESSDAGSTDRSGGRITVGALAVSDGGQTLDDLAAWHQSTAEPRGFQLGEDAHCWFGRIGEAVVQNAHCGPVTASDTGEPRFDLVPLRFEDVEPGVVMVQPITDAVVTDEVLPGGLELIGADGVVDPNSLASAQSADGSADEGSAGARGERAGSD